MPVTVGILAGGRSTRMGRDKAELFLDRVRARFAGRDLLISGPRDIPDLLPVQVPLAGIHALLHHADRVFVCACDMPFVSVALADHLASFDGDLILPVSPDGEEPLHAVYAKACIPAIERRVREGNLRTTGFADLVKTVRVPVDPREWLVDGRSPFLNINRPEDLAAGS